MEKHWVKWLEYTCALCSNEFKENVNSYTLNYSRSKPFTEGYVSVILESVDTSVSFQTGDIHNYYEARVCSGCVRAHKLFPEIALTHILKNLGFNDDESA